LVRNSNAYMGNADLKLSESLTAVPAKTLQYLGCEPNFVWKDREDFPKRSARQNFEIAHGQT
jgi:hypothetical protein